MKILIFIVDDSSGSATLQSKPTVVGISETCFAAHIYFLLNGLQMLH